jgi:acyl carrier protein
MTDSSSPEPSLTRLRKVVAELMPQAGGLEADADLFAEGLDSIALMQLIILLEQEFGIKFTSADLDRANFSTLVNLQKLVESKLAPA